MNEKENLITEIMKLQDRMSRLSLQYKSVNFTKLDVTMDQLKSLIFVQLRGSSNLRHLAEELGITPANMTGIADRLSASGLVNRRQNPEDRREQLLELTDEGEELLNALRDRMIKEESEILNHLNSEELGALITGLSAFVKAAESYVQSHQVVNVPH